MAESQGRRPSAQKRAAAAAAISTASAQWRVYVASLAVGAVAWSLLEGSFTHALHLQIMQGVRLSATTAVHPDEAGLFCLPQ